MPPHPTQARGHPSKIHPTNLFAHSRQHQAPLSDARNEAVTITRPATARPPTNTQPSRRDRGDDTEAVLEQLDLARDLEMETKQRARLAQGQRPRSVSPVKRTEQPRGPLADKANRYLLPSASTDTEWDADNDQAQSQAPMQQTQMKTKHPYSSTINAAKGNRSVNRSVNPHQDQPSHAPRPFIAGNMRSSSQITQVEDESTYSPSIPLYHPTDHAIANEATAKTQAQRNKATAKNKQPARSISKSSRQLPQPVTDARYNLPYSDITAKSGPPFSVNASTVPPTPPSDRTKAASPELFNDFADSIPAGMDLNGLDAFPALSSMEVDKSKFPKPVELQDPAAIVKQIDVKKIWADSMARAALNKEPRTWENILGFHENAAQELTAMSSRLNLLSASYHKQVHAIDSAIEHKKKLTEQYQDSAQIYVTQCTGMIAFQNSHQQHNPKKRKAA